MIVSTAAMKQLLCLCVCAAVALALDAPQQIHIAFAGKNSAGDPSGMAVSWQTVQDTATSVVRFGLSPDSLQWTASGASSTYYKTYDHHVVIEGLQPNTKYFYQCGDAQAGWSDVLWFVTAPAKDAVTYPIRIAIVGDLGSWYSEDTRASLLKLADQDKYDWVWHLGDVGYADDDWLHEPFKEGYEEAYNVYMNSIQDVISKRAYMVLVGNHEAECHSPACQVSRDALEHLGNFSAYNHRFRMPSTESGGNSNMWYSFNFGPIHFVGIDTETNYDGAPNDHYTWYGDNGDFWGNQVAWLEQDLKKANADRHSRPWILVGGHRPIYSVDNCDETGVATGTPAKIQAAFEGLFQKYHVDQFWAGHKHSYERQWPVYNNTHVDKSYTDSKYPVHIINGAAGNDEQLSNYKDVAGTPWSAFWDTEHYGFGILTVESASTLTWTYYDSATLAVLDKATFTKTL